jgi:hypothetical protein
LNGELSPCQRDKRSGILGIRLLQYGKRVDRDCGAGSWKPSTIHEILMSASTLSALFILDGPLGAHGAASIEYPRIMMSPWAAAQAVSG